MNPEENPMNAPAEGTPAPAEETPETTPAPETPAEGGESAGM